MDRVEEMSTLDILLGNDLPDMRKKLPEKRVEVPRLSQEAGKPVIFTLRALSYDKVREIQDKPRSEQALYGVLYGCAEPNWRGGVVSKIQSNIPNTERAVSVRGIIISARPFQKRERSEKEREA